MNRLSARLLAHKKLIAVPLGLALLVVAAAVVLGSVGPSADFLSPLTAGGTSLQSSTSINVAWTENDPSATGIASRSLQRQRGAIVTAGTCSGVTWSDDGSPTSQVSPVAQSGLSSGFCYRWAQTLTDNQAEQGTSVSGNLLVDNSAPTVPTVNAIGNNVYQSGTTIYFKKNTSGSLTLTASGSDAQSNIAADGIAFSELSNPANGWSPQTSLSGQPNPANRVYAWQTGGSSTPSFTVTATNGAGLSTTSPTYTFEGDSTIPGSAFSVPASDLMQSSTSITLTWDEWDTHSGVDSRSLQRQRGAIVTAGTCAGVSWSNDGSPTSQVSPVAQSGLLTGFCYRWALTLTDHVGNGGHNVSTGTTTSPTVLVDTSKPSAPSLVVSGTGVYQASAGSPVWFRPTSGSLTVTATSSDPESGVASHSFGVLSTATGWSYTPAVVSGNPASRALSFTAEALGTTLPVQAINGSGLTSDAATVSFTPDGDAPVIAFTTPSDGTAYLADSSVDVAWTESDAGSGIFASSILRQRGAVVTAGTCAGVTWANDGAPDPGLSPRTNSGLLDGYCYRWILSVGDNVGNAASALSGSLLVDINAPSQATVNVTGTAGAGGWFISPVKITLSASDSASGVQRIQYSTLADPVVHNYAGPFFMTADGDYYLSLRVTDQVGHVTDSQYRLQIDHTAPSINFTFPTGELDQFVGATIGDATSGLAFYSFVRERTLYDPIANTCTDAWGLETSNAWQPADGDATRVIQVVKLNMLPGLCYRWSVRAVDFAGNTSSVRSGEVTPDLLRMALVIVDCADPTDSSRWVTNKTGTITWSAGNSLCLRPTVDLNQGDAQTGPWKAQLISHDSYTVLSHTNAVENEQPIMTLDGDMGVERNANDVLRLTVNQETGIYTLPYVSVTYRAVVTVGWFDGQSTDPIYTTQLSADFQIHVVAVNLGQTPIYQEP